MGRKSTFIRFEIHNDINPKLNCGLFSLPTFLYNTESLTTTEKEQFNILLAELPEPQFEEQKQISFYFTEQGYAHFKPLVDTIKKGLIDLFYVKELYLSVAADDPKILYDDQYQIAISKG